jgi:hypothetical protein
MFDELNDRLRRGETHARHVGKRGTAGVRGSGLRRIAKDLASFLDGRFELPVGDEDHVWYGVGWHQGVE